MNGGRAPPFFIALTSVLCQYSIAIPTIISSESATLVALLMEGVKTYDEIALLHRLKKDDAEAYIQLYDHYQALLYGYILHFVKVPVLAEDVLQDVFLKLWEVRHRVNPDLSFSGYLYRISRNQVFKLVKKIAVDEDVRLGVMRQLGQNVEEGELKLQWKQYEALLTAAIAQLSPQRQKVFHLCREQGKTYEEAAQELGISRNTVKEHMVLAVRAIKDYLTRHGDISLLYLLFFWMGNKR